MLRGPEALLEAGMPESHGAVFQAVANAQRCVISSRAVGKAARGLLEESYATKGFHNKAKSCSWGPMAGFVMSDPRFTKNKDLGGQREDLRKAIKHGATTTELYISDNRRRELEGPLARITASSGAFAHRLGAYADGEVKYIADSPSGSSMTFVLRQTTHAPGAKGRPLWAVFYDAKETRLSADLRAEDRAAGGELLPVLAMVDPACPADVKDTYRAATTGDYDLFAVLPRRRDFDRAGDDARLVPGSDRFQRGLPAYIRYEDPHLGNDTRRLKQIRELLNNGILAAGYTGGNVVHHSDEAGRPLVSSIDFPFIAFVPGRRPYCALNTADFHVLISLLQFEYVTAFNPGWFSELGISVSAAGSYEV